MSQETSSATLLAAGASANRRAGHVLLVDDDLAVVAAFRAAIEYEGYRCSIFGSASALLADRAFLAAIPTIPTCILSDVKMPGLDGLELQRELPTPWYRWYSSVAPVGQQRLPQVSVVAPWTFWLSRWNSRYCWQQWKVRLRVVR